MPEAASRAEIIDVPGGLAHADVVRADQESMTAHWSALEQHVLRARVDGPQAMAAILNAWQPAATTTVADVGTGDAHAVLTWPTRDVEMVRVFRRAGLAPHVITAVRPAGRSTPQPNPASYVGTRIRALGDDDVDQATRLWLELTRWDNQFLMLPERPGAAARYAADLIAKERAWRWVAEEDDGTLIGMLLLGSPEESAWMQPMVAPVPVAYLGAMYVAPSHRGTGVGAAMVERSLAAADAGSIPVTVLHYSALNPLSVPFWHRMGFRPLWTTWIRPLT